MKINSLDLTKLRSNEHFQFVTDAKAVLTDLPADSAAKIQPQIAAFAAAIAEEDIVLKKIMKSTLTAKIHEADDTRDAIFRGLTNAVKSARNHFTAAVREAAGNVWNTMAAYKNVAAMGDIEETSALYNLCQDLTTKHTDDLTAIGVAAWVPELDRANKVVEDLLRLRDTEVAERPSKAMKDVRRRVDEAYRLLTLVVEALSVMETGTSVAGIKAVIARLNATIDRYAARIAQRYGRKATKDKPDPDAPDDPADPQPDPDAPDPDGPQPDPDPDPDPDPNPYPEGL